VKRRAAIVEGRFDLPRSRRIYTVAGFVKEHYAAELEHRGLRGFKTEVHRVTKGPLGQFFGHLRLTDLDQWKVRQYMKARRGGKLGSKGAVTAGAINRDLARLKNLWTFAKRRGLVVGDNPVSAAGRLDEPQHRVRYLTPEEEERLLAVCPPALRAIVEFALHTGIRKGAIFGLRWRDVDLAAHLISVPTILSKSKTLYHVAINERVAEILAERQRGRFTGPDDFVFGKGNGQQRRSVERTWREARAAAGLPGFRFHDLRHTSASRIVQAGLSLFDAGEHLGHKTPMMTKRYAHLSPERLHRIAAATIRQKGDVLPIMRAPIGPS
jgi:integrase